ncbi:MAG: MarR family transcriptional regulator [Ktedonobacterales bacterium]|nr:MarR family transcriptional regulator [Ktedonobacterales bacterium]
MEEVLAARFRKAYWAIVHNVDVLRLRIWEERGITLPQLRVLSYLRANPQATTNALARALGLTAPTVSGLVDKLVIAGLVVRGVNPDDRRVIPLSLTPEGTGVISEIRQGNQAYLSELAGDLGEDLEPIIFALEHLVAAIDERPARAAIAEDGATHT